MIGRNDVLAAERRISEHVRHTPLLRGGSASRPLWFKCEFMQHTGVLKARGAFNRQLSALERGEPDPDVGIVAGAGTLAKEILQDGPGIDTIVLATSRPAVAPGTLEEEGNLLTAIEAIWKAVTHVIPV